MINMDIIVFTQNQKFGLKLIMKEEDGANQLKFQLSNISHLGILLFKYVANFHNQFCMLMMCGYQLLQVAL